MSKLSLESQGLGLMIFGMGEEFGFLTMLVFVTGFMSKLVTKLTPEPVIVPAKVVTKKQPGVDPGVCRVLKDEVKEHRARQK